MHAILPCPCVIFNLPLLENLQSETEFRYEIISSQIPSLIRVKFRPILNCKQGIKDEIIDNSFAFD